MAALLAPLIYNDALLVIAAPPEVTVPIGLTTKFASMAWVPDVAVVIGAEPMFTAAYDAFVASVVEVDPFDHCLLYTVLAPPNSSDDALNEIAPVVPVAKSEFVEVALLANAKAVAPFPDTSVLKVLMLLVALILSTPADVTPNVALCVPS